MLIHSFLYYQCMYLANFDIIKDRTIALYFNYINLTDNTKYLISNNIILPCIAKYWSKKFIVWTHCSMSFILFHCQKINEIGRFFKNIFRGFLHLWVIFSGTLPSFADPGFESPGANPEVQPYLASAQVQTQVVTIVAYNNNFYVFLRCVQESGICNRKWGLRHLLTITIL